MNMELRKPTRIDTLDALRGLIIILMTLDHANYFVAQKHSSGEHWGGQFPTYHDSVAFLTRLVTHPVAPGFFFLMGVGMILFAQSRREKGWHNWEIIRHFLVRGAVLIGIQLLVVNRAWELGSQPFPRIYIGVLFALGGTMILCSFLLRLKPVALIMLAAALFVGIELTHPDPTQWGLIFDQPLGLLFGYSGGDSFFWSNYPVLPWLELVIFGMVFGHWFAKDPQKAYKRAIWLGVICLLGFIVLRTLDGFGNIRPRMGNDWIDYLNPVKYPPSMTFTLMTMGVNMLLLGLLAKMSEQRRKVLHPLVTLGQVPLFSYILHLFIYAAMGRLLTPSGTSIPAMYPYWILGLFLLYPLALWYGGFKHKQPANSILRFL